MKRLEVHKMKMIRCLLSAFILVGAATSWASLPVGSGAQVIGANSTATALTNLTVTGTSNQVSVSTAATTITLGLTGGAAWNTYTPTVSAQIGTITTASASGRYQQIGKVVFITVTCTVTTAGTGSGNLSLSLPVTANTTITSQVVNGIEGATTGNSVRGLIGSTTMNIRDYKNAGVIVDGAVVFLTGSYEAS